MNRDQQQHLFRATTTTQAVGLTTALFLSGSYFTAAHLFITPLLPLPISESTRIFSHMDTESGRKVLGPLVILSVAANALAAYLAPPCKRPVFGLVGMVMLGTVVYEKMVMRAGVERLMEIRRMDGSEIQRVSKFGEVLPLLGEWKRQNTIRAGMSGLAGLMGVYAVISCSFELGS